jgi:hypothetical protein
MNRTYTFPDISGTPFYRTYNLDRIKKSINMNKQIGLTGPVGLIGIVGSTGPVGMPGIPYRKWNLMRIKAKIWSIKK